MRSVSAQEKNPARFAEALSLLTRKRNGTVTLTESDTTTIVTDLTINSESVIALMPTTANAAAALATTYIAAPIKGAFTITHANNAQADRTFRWAAVED